MRIGGKFAVLLLVPTASVAADEEPICADRPGISTPACTVPPGMVQVETGLADWSQDEQGGVEAESLAIGATAFKLGLTDRLHVEFDVAPYNWQRARAGGLSESLSGFGDIALAAKYRLTGSDSPLEVAVYPFVKIPTARDGLGNGKVEGGLIVPVSYAIPGTALSLALSPESDLVADDDGSGHHLATGQVVGLAFPLGRSLSASAEVAGYWDFAPGGTVRQYLFGGSAALLLSRNVQVDAGANIGLNREAPDVELYSGIAVRF